MLESIIKYQKSNKTFYLFSILIPSWNNLAYLQLCIRSILKNSQKPIQIIVIVNEGTDGTLDWLMQQDEIDFIHSKRNIGICYGLNIARSIIKSEWVVYVNDDMYLLPEWDLELLKEIERIGHKEFMLSSTMIEPLETGNPCVVVKNYGQHISDFKENDLLKEYSGLKRNDWSGSTWPPLLMHLDLWDLVGGMSIEFSPGMYSDPDLSKKLFEAGVRLFKGKGSSLVYHFGSKSTKRIIKNKGKNTFLHKWGMSSNTFTQFILKRGEEFNVKTDIQKLHPMILWKDRIKKFLSS
jgi:glycosyltransferase involved in cell wall biosynthesis